MLQQMVYVQQPIEYVAIFGSRLLIQYKPSTPTDCSTLIHHVSFSKFFLDPFAYGFVIAWLIRDNRNLHASSCSYLSISFEDFDAESFAKCAKM